jgi:hypothetical protein
VEPGKSTHLLNTNMIALNLAHGVYTVCSYFKTGCALSNTSVITSIKLTHGVHTVYSYFKTGCALSNTSVITSIKLTHGVHTVYSGL